MNKSITFTDNANDLELEILGFLQDNIPEFKEALNSMSMDDVGAIEERLIDLIETFLKKNFSPCVAAC